MADNPTETRRGVIVRRSRTGIYTAMLGVAALAMLIGLLMLLLETYEFGGPWAILRGPS